MTASERVATPFYHRQLDRFIALEVIARYTEIPEYERNLGPQAEAQGTSGTGTDAAEDKLAALLEKAGFPPFETGTRIDVGAPYGHTSPDFTHEDTDQGVRVALYLDGLSKGIHGDANVARKDAIVRAQIEELGWKVVAIPSSALDDPEMLQLFFKKIARVLGDEQRAEQLARDRSWVAADET